LYLTSEPAPDESLVIELICGPEKSGDRVSDSMSVATEEAEPAMPSSARVLPDSTARFVSQTRSGIELDTWKRMSDHGKPRS
jgi:hypothetical protein